MRLNSKYSFFPEDFMLFAICHIQFYFPYIFDVQEGKIGDQISTTISFEKATFKKSDQSIWKN